MDYLTWCVVVGMRLYVTYAPVDVANIGSGMLNAHSLTRLFYGHFQALEDVQLSQGFSIPFFLDLVMNNRGLIES